MSTIGWMILFGALILIGGIAAFVFHKWSINLLMQDRLIAASNAGKARTVSAIVSGVAFLVGGWCLVIMLAAHLPQGGAD